MNGRREQAVRIAVRGVVQGVGFRPFVARLAHKLAVRGWVRNGADGVRIHAEGTPDALRALLEGLPRDAPPGAVIASIEAAPAEVAGHGAFEIAPSDGAGPPTTRISPDLCVCEACARELRDPADPRFGYPYINCTHCGPRYSIILNLPYDRVATTMRGWAMCPACANAYGDPGDRRFHAQPVACPDCGPGYRLITDPREPGARSTTKITGHESRHGVPGYPVPGNPVPEAAAMLRGGKILAIKGLGGYHLACDAWNERAVAALRERKFRKEKPFALLVRTIEEARELAELSPEHERLLVSTARPIVLVPARQPPPGVAPGNDQLGLMLPSTPLHLILFDAEAPSPLVMTSANRSSEPIAYEDEDAFDRLAGIADAFLVGERPIARRVEDSVVAVRRVGGVERPFMIRRSRGYAPLPVATLETDRPIVALGADLKNSVALVVRGEVFVSQHIGDLGGVETDRAFAETIDDLLRMYAVDRRELLVVHDLHPEYASTRAAPGVGGGAVCAVQHHRAHIASVLAEHGLYDDRVVGVALDGTGFGDDGAIWGGEFFVGSIRAGIDRVDSLAPVRMPGGDGAARFPPQALAAYLHDDRAVRTLSAPPFGMPRRYADAARLVLRGVRCFETTSAGRLFDAAAAVCGFVRPISFEGQAAIWLENRARRGVGTGETEGASLEPGALLSRLVGRRRVGMSIEDSALWFHHALGGAIAGRTLDLARAHDCASAALSGGVWQNEVLLGVVTGRLESAGVRVLLNIAVPANDGGVCLGQVALASAMVEWDGLFPRR
jgi:hydrogenase maturation protein HypF